MDKIIRNWCSSYKPDSNLKVEMCSQYLVEKNSLSPICKLGSKAGLWCHVRPENWEEPEGDR